MILRADTIKHAYTHALNKMDELTGALVKYPEHLQSIASYKTLTRLVRKTQTDEHETSARGKNDHAKKQPLGASHNSEQQARHTSTVLVDHCT